MAAVRFFGALRDRFGRSGAEIDAATVGDLLKLLGASLDPAGRSELAACRVLVNGRNAGLLKGRRTRLEAGDAVTIFPPAAGG